MVRPITIIILMAVVLFNSCNNSDDITKTPLTINEVSFIDTGQTKPIYDFSIQVQENSSSIEIKTPEIRKDDELKKVTATIDSNNKIEIQIVTSPNDFECTENICFSNHTITLNIKELLHKGKYEINLGINNVYKEAFNFTIN